MATQERASGEPALDDKAANHSHRDKLEAFLRQEYDDGPCQAFVDNLAARGWLTRLEQAGVIPDAELPEAREQALQRLYIGALLAELDEQLLITPTLLFTRHSAAALFDDEN